MLRFSYEWIEEEAEEHWTENLYAVFDSKLGLTQQCAIAWTLSRDHAERIVDALNLADQRSRAVWELATYRSKYDLSDLLA